MLHHQLALQFAFFWSKKLSFDLKFGAELRKGIFDLLSFRWDDHYISIAMGAAFRNGQWQRKLIFIEGKWGKEERDRLHNWPFSHGDHFDSRGTENFCFAPRDLPRFAVIRGFNKRGRLSQRQRHKLELDYKDALTRAGARFSKVPKLYGSYSLCISRTERT